MHAKCVERMPESEKILHMIHKYACHLFASVFHMLVTELVTQTHLFSGEIGSGINYIFTESIFFLVNVTFLFAAAARCGFATFSIVACVCFWF